VSILGAEPRGIHALTCTGSGNPTGILLDGVAASIEDVFISGFGDGVLVGSRGPAPSNILLNIRGDTNLTNLIHISSQTTGGVANVTDLTILGVTSSASTGKTIRDDLTGPVLAYSTDPSVALYMVGEPVAVGGSTAYSRFSSSSTVPTWLVGGSAPAHSCAAGSLYSITSGATHLYGCVGAAWVEITHQ